MKPEGRRILVVDDHQDVAETTAELFRMAGEFEVEVASNGLAAVERARVFRPRAVVMDINMPVMDGYQAAGLLRYEQPPHVPLLLVALTGRTQEQDRSRALEAGFDHHFKKPLTSLQLFDLVSGFFAEHSTSDFYSL